MKKVLIIVGVIIALVIFAFTAEVTSYDSYGSCPVCDGNEVVEEEVTCTDCKGRGEVFCIETYTFNYTWLYGGGSETVTCKRGMHYNPRGDFGDETCWACKGSTYHDCYTCNGYGYITTDVDCENCETGTVKTEVKSTIANAYWGIGR